MTKEKIKEALRCCKNQCCSYCPHWCEKGCQYQTLSNALDLITEQENEIDRLKAKDEETCLKCIESKHATAEEYAKFQEEFVNYQLASDKEIRAQAKQAVKEFAEKLKRKLHYDYIMPSGTTDERYVFECIDELIKEVQND